MNVKYIDVGNMTYKEDCTTFEKVTGKKIKNPFGFLGFLSLWLEFLA